MRRLVELRLLECVVGRPKVPAAIEVVFLVEEQHEKIGGKIVVTGDAGNVAAGADVREDAPGEKERRGVLGEVTYQSIASFGSESPKFYPVGLLPRVHACL